MTRTLTREQVERMRKIGVAWNIYKVLDSHEHLRAEKERMKSMSTMEMMYENLNVKHHVEELEARCMKAEAQLAQVERDLRRWQLLHHAGCPTIADDESDEVLTDCGVCTCMPLQQQLASAKEELDRYHHWTPEHTIEQWLAEREQIVTAKQAEADANLQQQLTDAQARITELEGDFFIVSEQMKALKQQLATEQQQHQALKMDLLSPPEGSALEYVTRPLRERIIELEGDFLLQFAHAQAVSEQMKALKQQLAAMEQVNKDLNEELEENPDPVIDAQAKMIESYQQQLAASEQRVKQLEHDLQDNERAARDEIREALAEKEWQHRQGDDYGTY